jgi:hypothetical protein
MEDPILNPFFGIFSGNKDGPRNISYLAVEMPFQPVKPRGLAGAKLDKSLPR